MGNSAVEVITRTMDRHQEESREQFKELRESTATVAQAVADLTTTIARVEERHARHDDGLKRVGKVVDDHETRIRTLEGNKQAFKGSWKTITALVGGVVTILTLAAAFSGAIGG